ncbi:low temperature requirement protein A [Streptomyces albidoflavus]|uniref:low temperature requirement protein A n=1 Tax=Streptomyces albidoflavus TaxID=1886 RepID=UPI0033B85FC0
MTVSTAAIRRQVSPLELFFDLVFIFAFSQLAHHLVDHLTWRGAAETMVLLVGVCGTWAFTSFEATLLDISLPRTRLAVVIVMGLGLFMNVAISRAFTTAPWDFVVPLLAILVGMLVLGATAAPTVSMRHHYQRGLVWTAVAVPLWVTGAAVPPDTRLWWWGAAALVDLTGAWLAHPLPGSVLRSAHLDFDAVHMLERLRLFLILMLGETILTIGRTMSEATIDLPTVAAFVGIFVTLVCLWAAYFGGGEDIVAAHIHATADRIRSVRLGLNATYCTLASLIAVAAASELIISHPLHQTSAALALLLFGGPFFYLLSQAWYFRVTAGHAWVERLVACVACALATAAAPWLPGLASLALLDVILVAAAVALARVHRRLADDLKAAPGTAQG